MSTEHCIFCKIISGEIPAKFVTESKHAVAFHDIAPEQPVHVLVVPKMHYRDIVELSQTDAVAMQDLIELGCRVAQSMTDGSFKFTFNTGEAAGQTVFHAHGHILSTTPKQ